MQLQWSHCVLRVRDLEGMIAFYHDVLGFRVADRGPLGPDGPEIVFMSGSSSDHHQIAFAATRGEDTASSLEHIAFRVASLADVRAMLERVTKDERVENVLPLTHGNAISVYFADPEGNGIEIFCDTPWHVQQPQARPWDPSQSDTDVLARLESEFEGDPEFMPMERYRAQQARAFGEDA